MSISFPSVSVLFRFLLAKVGKNSETAKKTAGIIAHMDSWIQGFKTSNGGFHFEGNEGDSKLYYILYYNIIYNISN